MEENVLLNLFDCDAIKFGQFKLKSGQQSPIYIDLRVIVSYPSLMRQVSELLWQKISVLNLKFDSVCGVPYTALPLATCVTVHHDIPMLIRRKEAKDYGTRKIIEGKYTVGSKCLIIEDVVTSGSSVLETVDALVDAGLTCTDAVVLLDREQGGAQNLRNKGIHLHSVFSMSKLLEILFNAKYIDEVIVTSVKEFLLGNDTSTAIAGASCSVPNKLIPVVSKKYLTYEERSALCSHPVSKQLFSIMAYKKTNLAVSADVTTCAQLLQLADSVGPHICVLKTHVDILSDFNLSFVDQLKECAKKHNFLLFEDRKFADIGNTVKMQYSGSLYHIADWADFVNVHALPGPGVIESLKQVGLNRGCLIVAEMSSNGNLINEEYVKGAVKMASNHSDFVIGFICQHQLTEDPRFIHMVPGISIENTKDTLGQQYTSPSTAIETRGNDIIIVGRAIINSSNPASTAKTYKEISYDAYLNSLKQLS